ncbi:uncharacterized protein LOC123516867 [Portunus trituberculatus]|uniref:uncharacterized protein LOC123516867 n=1 Tax=Portunus trituberculatus TaxID=210409 RepID=UPI001E1CF588|nr:uncharacterized protein LOC123516867 [Portunus trituberculatus]XP_045132513.1 uncharacterized protein LOC123516867 [Portunus trituberculatus]XP_045132514.1 uncharacterized protein LOC123516867 [Portunus trituberculatus]
MAVAVLLTAAVMIGESVFSAASPIPQPTTYSPLTTNTPAAPPATPTKDAVEVEGGGQGKDSEPAAWDHSLEESSSMPSADAAGVDSVILRQEYENQPAIVDSLAPDAMFTDGRTHTIPAHHGREWESAGTDRMRQPINPGKSLTERDVAVGRDAPPRASHTHKRPLPASRPPPPRVINLSAVRASLATLSTAGLGAMRSVRLMFMLMQYLGFLPHIPGLPKYEDPAKIRPSIHYTLPREDAGLL